MIKCIALDDEPLALEVIQAFCAEVPFLELEKTFTDASVAGRYLKNFPVDLIFLDIRMPDISGIDFYKSLSQELMVIFTTAYSEFAVEGFNLSAIDYLLKPFNKERFMQAVNKAKEYHDYMHHRSGVQEPCLYVRSEYSLVKILVSDILYIEGLDDYIKIHTANKKPVLTLMSLKAAQEKLPVEDFVRVHRSFIVALKKNRIC